MVLSNNDLAALVTVLDLSVKALRRIKINYFWAFAYNATLVPLSAGVLYPSLGVALAPMYAGVAMAMSSVSIVFSSLMLFLYAPPLALGKKKGAGTRGRGKKCPRRASKGSADEDVLFSDEALLLEGNTPLLLNVFVSKSSSTETTFDSEPTEYIDDNQTV
jgi:hypothetical protein